MKNILIIDDNKDITGLFKTILESAEHKCTAVHDGGKRSGNVTYKIF